MDKKYIVVADVETTSLNCLTGDIIQLSAITVDPIRLECVPNSEFNCLMKPLNVDGISDEALTINRRTREEIMEFIHPKLAFQDFVEYMKALNPRRTPYTAPILCGHNVGFDKGFIEQLCKKYGEWDDNRNQQTLYNQFSIDTMQLAFSWFENNNDVKNLKLDTLREYLGITGEGAHEALKDVMDTAAILIRFLKLQRNVGTKVKFKNAFKTKELNYG